MPCPTPKWRPHVSTSRSGRQQEKKRPEARFLEPKACALSQGRNQQRRRRVPLPGCWSLPRCGHWESWAYRGQRTGGSGARPASPGSWKLSRVDFPPSSICSARRQNRNGNMACRSLLATHPRRDGSGESPCNSSPKRCSALRDGGADSCLC